MKKDIVLAGVGGQGILTISVLIVNAAIREGYDFRQSEIHGMSQRGGAVECHVRFSKDRIYSNIIAKNQADLIIGVEPLEALRQINYLSPSGIVVTNTVPVKNISNYPEEKYVMDMLLKSGRKIYLVEAAEMAKQAGNIRSQNVVLIGAASNFLGLKTESLKEAIKEMFSAKGTDIVKVNLKAFELGLSGVKEMGKTV